MNFKMTQEQSDIEKAFLSGKNQIVKAGAGTGKTSTIKILASQMEGLSGLYTAFNKMTAEEVKGHLPSSVQSRTTHSLAYQAIGHKYKDKLSRPQGKYVNVALTPAEIARYFNIKAVESVRGVDIAIIVKATLGRFECSATDALNINCVPRHLVKDLVDKARERDEYASVDAGKIGRVVLEYAVKLWEGRKDVNSDVLITHDTYLKFFQLSQPQLGFDVIFADEFQDANPCTLAIVENQENCQIVAVGDSSQAIYQWRGSINAMEIMGYDEYPLTQSFRFGQNVADVANSILLGATDLILKGNPTNDTQVTTVDYDQPYTVIFRTNGSLLSRAVALITDGVSVNIQTNTYQFCRKLEESAHLREGNMKKVKHEDLIGFKNWSELCEEAANDPELKRIVSMINSNTHLKVLRLLKNYKTPANPHATLITAHKSKGNEYAQVVLDDDFPEISPEMATQDRNLLYVAATRAMKTLQLNSDLTRYITSQCQTL
jgi:superfamily I DNA/RNA helicase